VTRPLYSLRRSGAQVAVAKSTKTFGIDLDHSVGCVAIVSITSSLSHVSNGTGCVSPVKEIAEMTHERGGLLILDAAQSVGDLDIDMQDLGVDVLAAPGHKGLYGPMGTGVLVLSAPLPVKPFREGGTGEGFRMPARGDLSARTEGRRSKAPQEGIRGGRMGGCCLWGFYGQRFG
jgi:selenocysteine lyase/cysteine desulfurase